MESLKEHEGLPFVSFRHSTDLSGLSQLSAAKHLYSEAVTRNLPVALAKVADTHLEELLIGLGSEIISSQPTDRLRLNFVFDCSDMVVDSEAWQRMEAAMNLIESYTQYKPSLAIFAPEVERGAIPAKIPVFSTEERLSRFALNERIFWVGGPVDPAFDSQCQSSGMVVIPVPIFDDFVKYLPREPVYFFNNQPGFRIIISVTPASKDSVEAFIGYVRTRRLTLPILLWIASEDQTLISDGIWSRFSRIWCTSRPQVLFEYCKTQVGLLWAPELRHGTLDNLSWKGTVTIKDLAGRNIMTRGTKTPASYVTAGIDENLFTTKVLKDSNPKWTSLDFVCSCKYNSNIAFFIYDKGKSAPEGRVDAKISELLAGVSSVGVPYLVKTFPIKRVGQKTTGKSKKSVPALNPYLGTLTITIVFSSDLPPFRSHVPGFEKDLTYADLFVKNTQFFCNDFPTMNNLLVNVCGEDQGKMEACLEHAADTRSAVHKSVIPLMREFLDIKREFGTRVEKEVYRGMTVESLTTRIFLKRPLTFYLVCDDTLLRDGSTYNDWAKVGTEDEGNIKLRDYMSYDELLLSALFCLASPTFFINNGDRKNCGRIAFDVSTFEQEGIFVGVVGTRFERTSKMESIHMLVSQKESIPEKGYGMTGERNTPHARLLHAWAKFYEQGNVESGNYYFPSWQECVEEYECSSRDRGLGPPNPSGTEAQFRWKNVKYLKVKEDLFLNIDVYKRRLKLTIETFLTIANTYAQNDNKMAFCHVVGLGLGSWCLKPFLTEQSEIILLCYYELLTEKAYPFISDIAFSWFPDNITEFCGKQDGDLFTTSMNRITIWIGKRNPSDPIADPCKLLVSQYAWDSNAFPGNEYWLGARHLTMSGDPAAACSSTIIQIQNPQINPSFLVKPPILVGEANASVKRKGEDGWKEEKEVEEGLKDKLGAWKKRAFEAPRKGRSRGTSVLSELDGKEKSHQQQHKLQEHEQKHVQETLFSLLQGGEEKGKLKDLDEEDNDLDARSEGEGENEGVDGDRDGGSKGDDIEEFDQRNNLGLGVFGQSITLSRSSGSENETQSFQPVYDEENYNWWKPAESHVAYEHQATPSPESSEPTSSETQPEPQLPIQIPLPTLPPQPSIQAPVQPTIQAPVQPTIQAPVQPSMQQPVQPPQPTQNPDTTGQQGGGVGVGMNPFMHPAMGNMGMSPGMGSKPGVGMGPGMSGMGPAMGMGQGMGMGPGMGMGGMSGPGMGLQSRGKQGSVMLGQAPVFNPATMGRGGPPPFMSGQQQQKRVSPAWQKQGQAQQSQGQHLPSTHFTSSSPAPGPTSLSPNLQGLGQEQGQRQPPQLSQQARQNQALSQRNLVRPQNAGVFNLGAQIRSNQGQQGQSGQAQIQVPGITDELESEQDAEQETYDQAVQDQMTAPAQYNYGYGQGYGYPGYGYPAYGYGYGGYGQSFGVNMGFGINTGQGQGQFGTNTGQGQGFGTNTGQYGQYGQTFNTNTGQCQAQGQAQGHQTGGGFGGQPYTGQGEFQQAYQAYGYGGYGGYGGVFDWSNDQFLQGLDQEQEQLQQSQPYLQPEYQLPAEPQEAEPQQHQPEQPRQPPRPQSQQEQLQRAHQDFQIPANMPPAPTPTPGAGRGRGAQPRAKITALPKIQRSAMQSGTQ